MKTAPLGLLRWVYIGRLTLASGIFAGALLAWFRVTPLITLVATVLLLGSLAMTLGGLWHTHLRRREPGHNFLYLQVIFDVILVAGVVHITGSSDSQFAPLFILVIASGALLLPMPGGVLIGALASLLYFTDIVWLQAEPPPPRVFLQIALFAVIAIVTGYLGQRLRRAGTALGEAESQLRQLRLDTSDILRTIDTGVVTVDGDGRLVYLNKAAEVLLGLPATEWWGRVVLPELDHRAPGLGELLRATSRQGRPIQRREITVAGANQRVLGLSTAILEREGVPSVTAVFQDITDSKRVQELHTEAVRLQAMARLSASMAHEIKNPLASVRSAVEQLTGSGSLDSRDRDRLRDLVLNESERLTRLLSGFIEYSRVELRQSDSVELDGIIAEAVELVDSHPDSADGNPIHYSRPADAVMVQGDADLLHRAVFNLLLNAVQHAGPDGHVEVEVAGVPETHLPAGLHIADPVRISIRDDGPGLDPHDLPRVFDPFFSRRRGGTGLGLAVVQRAVDAHHGKILVDSRPGDGATFTIFLPANKAVTP